MKRQLTKEEKEITNKNLQHVRDELKSAEGSLKYNQAVLEKQTYLRGFQEKWKDYLYMQKDTEDSKLVEAMKVKIEQTREAITLTEKQLNEGVEVAKNSAVNN